MTSVLVLCKVSMVLVHQGVGLTVGNGYGI